MTEGKRCEVVLEVPEGWFQSGLDGHRHSVLYSSVLAALARLQVKIDPIRVPFGADLADRILSEEQFVISYHSRGPSGNILRVKESYIPPYYTFDPLGYSGFSSLGQNPEDYRESVNRFPRTTASDFVKNLSQELVAAKISKYAQPEKEIDPCFTDFVFFPLQTEDDPVKSLAYLDQLDVLRELAALSASNGYQIVVKRHPMCKSRRVERQIQEIDASFDNVVFLDASIHDLILRSRCVIGCNSGVLFESLCLGRPTISFGISDFLLATANVRHLDELAGAIQGRGQPEAEFRQQFIAWFLNVQCVKSTDISEIERRIRDALGMCNDPNYPFDKPQSAIFDYAASVELERRKKVLEEGG